MTLVRAAGLALALLTALPAAPQTSAQSSEDAGQPAAGRPRKKNFRRMKKTTAPAPTAGPSPAPAAKPAAPPTVCEKVNRIFLRVDALVQEGAEKDARTFSRVDKVVREYKAPITALGVSAVPCLAAIALDPLRLEKSRLWALTFMTFIKRYPVFFPVKGILLDPASPAELRSAAASYLPLLKGLCDETQDPDVRDCVTREAIDRTLCASLEDKALPAPVLREALSRVARSGCDEPGPLEGWIRSFGVHPKGKDWENAHLAILALTRGRTLPSTRVLLRLFEHYPTGSRGRKLLYKALLDKRGDLLAIRDTATPMLSWALQSEPGPAGELLALETLALVRDPKTAAVFLRYLEKKDPEVVAAAAAGLAAVGAKNAIPTLEKLLAGVMDDPRFQANADQDRPREAVARIRSSLDDLWRQ
ncbi:MAG: HEAT repeat domain-containing protein [Elusimicrobiota bacterium]|jgi:hypothetical protein